MLSKNTNFNFFFFLKERQQEVSYLGKVLQGDLILEQLPVTSMASGLIHPLLQNGVTSHLRSSHSD